MVFDVFTELPNIFFTVAAAVDTGVPRGTGRLVVDGSGAITLHSQLARPGPTPEEDQLDQT